MKEINLIGIDLAKSVFHICCADGSGHIVLEKRMRSEHLMTFLKAQRSCLVAMESCGTSNHWGCVALGCGHTVRLIHPVRVAAFLGAQKNDTKDARAICEAARQPSTQAIPVKSVEQQVLQCLVRLRQSTMRQRTQTINRLRGILAEFGYAYPKGALAFCRPVSELRANEVL